MTIPWSDDCLSCLCNLPHTLAAHTQAVERAHAELREQLADLRERNRDDDRRCDDERCIICQGPAAYSCLFSAENEEEDRDCFCAAHAQAYGYVFCGVRMQSREAG